MTVGSMMGVLLTLGFVLALLGVALKLLRRFAPTASTGARLRMEIVQRLALGPKQGIAVIQVGERLVAVSVGEGGIHHLFELDAAELTKPAMAITAPVSSPARTIDFTSVLRGALKNAGLVLVFLIAGAVGSSVVKAQAAPVTAPKVAAPAAVKPAAPKVTTPLANAQTGQAAPATTAKTAVAPRSLIDAPLSKLAPQMDLRVGSGDGLHLSGTVGIVVMMGVMTLLPTLLLMMTGFTRILIVLNFLRQAMGTQSAPPTQLVAALALLLTGFVMAPTLSELNRTALTPWMDGKIDQTQMMELGAKPFRAFMLKQTRRQDIQTFVRISKGPQPATINDVPLVTLTSAFVISELRTSFQIGFALFLPFIVIDIAVSSVLMSMGMFMLPPAMISLPFKLLLFVLVDGWSLIVQSLITSFR
ncbi:MAG TPA: flagellar type III secretion system pore protein FliP [Gemmatimonadaceae bacterium]|nr:flagellar type III secretion system pore protein FliP [Gemmatimonadaceae bacterium]